MLTISVGDAVVFDNLLYLVVLTITMADGTLRLALRQTFWPSDMVLLVDTERVSKPSVMAA